MTRRDALVAVVSVLATVCVLAAFEKPASVLRSSIFEWNESSVKSTEVGSVRQIVRGPTATLEELEMHVTTLNPGLAPHSPHRHPNEELIIVKEGTVEALVNGEWKRVGPGSVIFNASNDLHGLKNVGAKPATYHVINWTSSATPKISK